MALKAILALADGSIFHGQAIGAAGESVGEVVFNTAMTGYQEILTDPSYARQLVTLTFPHIGNTGCNAADEEAAAADAVSGKEGPIEEAEGGDGDAEYDPFAEFVQHRQQRYPR